MKSGAGTRGRTVPFSFKRALCLTLLIAAALSMLIGMVSIGSDESSAGMTFTHNNVSYEVIEGTDVKVTGYTGTSTVLVLSSTVTYEEVTYDVVALGARAFESNKVVETVSIPSSVLTIGQYCFYKAESLTSMVVPGSVSVLDQYTFSRCTKLSSLTISEGVETLNQHAVDNCSLIEAVLIPSTVSDIDPLAFYNCTNLTKFSVNSGNPVYSADDDEGIIYTNAGLTCAICPQGKIGEISFTGGPGIQNIGDYAFYNCTSITSISVPQTIASIGMYAFAGCSGASVISIPTASTNLRTIGDYAFSGCSQISKFSFTRNVTAIPEGMFYNCTSLYDVSFNNVTTIGSKAFMGCTSLEKASMGSVTTVGTSAFNGCIALSSVAFSAALTTIGSSAFIACANITKLSVPDTIAYTQSMFEGCVNVAEVTILHEAGQTSVNLTSTTCTYTPWYISSAYHEEQGDNHRISVSLRSAHNLTNLGDYLFYGCARLQMVELPASLTTIGKCCFYKCTGMFGSLSLPSTLVTVGDLAFYGCTRISGNIKILKNLKTIGYGAFGYCSEVTGFTLANDNNSFSLDSNGILYDYNKTRLIQCYGSYTGSVSQIPDTVKTIGYGAFAGCRNLTGALPMGTAVTTIESYAYAGCIGLTGTLSIPSTVTTISNHVFSGCSGFKTISLPDSVKSYGEYVFENCTGLLGTITVPTEMTKIPKGLFRGCYNITGVTFHSGVTQIGESAFEACTGFTELIIPTSVTYLGDRAFYGCYQIVSLTIPISLSAGGSNNALAFYDCYSINEIHFTIGTGVGAKYGNNAYLNTPWYISRDNDIEATFSEGITSIGDFMFYKCAGLKGSITLPVSLTEIGQYAFAYCTGLDSIFIGEKVVSIGTSALSYCSTMKTINVSEYNTAYCSQDGVLFNYVKTELIACPGGIEGEFVIPNTITSIGNYTFRGCSNMTGLVIPNSVTSIGQYSLADCTSLTNLTIPIKMTINNNAFDGTQNITYITFTEGDSIRRWFSTPWGGGSGPLYITFSDDVTVIPTLFSNNTRLVSVVIGNNVTSIEMNTFNKCYSLSELTIPITAVTGIKNGAFMDCTGLTKLRITPGVSGIPGGNFTEATYKYTPWYISRNNEIDLVLEDGVRVLPDHMFRDSSLLRYTLPDSITSIGSYAFFGTYGSEVMYIGANVEYIGNSAFSNCGGIKTFRVDDDNHMYSTDQYGILHTENYITLVQCPGSYTGEYVVSAATESILSYAFYGCTELTSITLSETLSSLSDYAFYGCSKLTKIVMPVDLQITSTNIFNQCTAITDIEFTFGRTGSSVNYDWQTYTFTPWYKCRTNEIHVKFDDSIIYVGTNLFSNCTGLRTLLLPNALENIASGAFSNCNQLNTLAIGITLNIAAMAQYLSTSSLTSVTLKPGVDGYGTDYTLSNYGNLPWRKNTYSDITITIEEGVKTIGDYTFYNTPKIVSVNFPESLTSLGISAFSNTGITVAEMHDNIENIGEYCFYNCTSLTTVSLPNSENLFTIPKATFKNCSLLISVSIPSSVETLGDSVFENCTSLTSFVIPDEVRSIGENTFGGCSSITSLTMPIDLDVAQKTFTGLNGVKTVILTPHDLGTNPPVTETSSAYYPWRISREPSITVIMEEGVSVLGEYLFYKAESVSIVQFPSTLYSVGLKTFYGCVSLKYIDMGGSIVESIGESAFEGCINAEYLRVPAPAYSVGSRAFSKCQALKSISIPTGMVIFRNTFTDVNNLEELFIIPGTGMAEMGFNLEYDEVWNYTPWNNTLCEDLSVTVEAGVHSIGGDYFRECYNMTYVAIFDTETEVPSDAFQPYMYAYMGGVQRTIRGGYQYVCTKEYVDNHYVLTMLMSPIVAVESVRLDPSHYDLLESVPGDEVTCQLNLIIDPADALVKGITWTSSNVLVASVDEDGLVTTGIPGVAIITVSVISGTPGGERVTASCEIVVSHSLTYYSSREPTCTARGILEHYHCNICGKNYADAEATQEMSTYYIPASHKLEYVQSREPTCIEEGVIEHYHCTACGKNFKDSSATNEYKSVVIAKLSHEMTFHEGYPAEGMAAGQIDYYHCSSCDYNYADKNGQRKLDYLDTHNVVLGVNQPDYGSIDVYSIPNVVRGSVIRIIDNVLTLDGVAVVATPTAENPERFYYFDSWSVSDGTVIKDYTHITAYFTSVIRSYEVKYYDAEGLVMESYIDKYGTQIVLPDIPPQKRSTEQYIYQFDYWYYMVGETKKKYTDGMKLDQNYDFYPSYTQSIREYRLTFKSDGIVFAEYYQKYGTTIVPPSDVPEKEQSERYVYTFDHWDGYTSGMKVTDNRVFEAVFYSSLREYTVTFMNVVDIFVRYSLTYNEVIPDPGTPDRPNEGYFQFVFTGWDNYIQGQIVTEDVTYNALYEKNMVTYEIDGKGEVNVDSTDTRSFYLSRDVVLKLKQDATQSNLVSVTFKFELGTIELDTGAILSIPNTKHKVSFDILDATKVPAGMKNVVGERTVYSINIGSIHQFDGNLAITIGYHPGEKERTDYLNVIYVTTAGESESMSAIYTDNAMSFTTSHLSYYAVMYEPPAAGAGDITFVSLVAIVIGIVMVAAILVLVLKRNMI